MPSKSTPQSLNALPPGTVLRDYVIESELGSGGFSIVYLARHSRSRAPYTPGYAAYEQVSSMGEIGPWTDVYALGALMWRMVAGGCPGDSRLHVLDESPSTERETVVWSPTPREVEKRAYALNRGSADLTSCTYSPSSNASASRLRSTSRVPTCGISASPSSSQGTAPPITANLPL